MVNDNDIQENNIIATIRFNKDNPFRIRGFDLREGNKKQKLSKFHVKDMIQINEKEQVR